MDTTTTKLTEASLMAYLFGEKSWAEIVGFTAQHARAVAGLGVSLLEAGRLDQATVVFDGLLAFNARDAFAHTMRATIAERQSDLETAWAHFTAAAILEPDYLPALMGRAQALLRMNEAAAARPDLEAVAAGSDPVLARRAAALLARLPEA